jgi:hypothetical protein
LLTRPGTDKHTLLVYLGNCEANSKCEELLSVIVVKVEGIGFNGRTDEGNT